MSTPSPSFPLALAIANLITLRLRNVLSFYRKLLSNFTPRAPVSSLYGVAPQVLFQHVTRDALLQVTRSSFHTAAVSNSAVGGYLNL